MNDRPMYVFAGGGSGGHLFPGFAVADELLIRNPTSGILFIGSERDIESRIIADKGFAHQQLNVEASTHARRHPFKFLWRNWRAYHKCLKRLRDMKPLAVVGLGGFASVSVVLAASRINIPVILLEQNAVPGRATRWLSRRADLVCVTFEDSVSSLPRAARIEVTGNPIRSQITNLCVSSATVDQTRPVLLVLGGSQGAAAINDAMMQILMQSDFLKQFRIIHQTGAAQCELVREFYRQHKVDAVVEAFFSDLTEHYQRATLVVSRAGATTLTELACARIPAVLVPYPHAADNHQLMNARVFDRSGAAIIVEQQSDRSMMIRRLSESLEELLQDDTRLNAMRLAMGSLARPAATQRVADCLDSLIQQKNATTSSIQEPTRNMQSRVA